MLIIPGIWCAYVVDKPTKTRGSKNFPLKWAHANIQESRVHYSNLGFVSSGGARHHLGSINAMVVVIVNGTDFVSQGGPFGLIADNSFLGRGQTVGSQLRLRDCVIHH